MKHKKKWLTAFGLLVSILALLPFSTAYLSHVETKDNPITIEEEFTPPKAWQPNTAYRKDVKVRNKGTVPCYIRVYVAVSDSDIRVDLDYDTSAWVQGDDGYWYYRNIIQPAACTSSLFTKVMLRDINEEQIKNFDIIVYAESVQAEGYDDIQSAFASIR